MRHAPENGSGENEGHAMWDDAEKKHSRAVEWSTKQAGVRMFSRQRRGCETLKGV